MIFQVALVFVGIEVALGGVIPTNVTINSGLDNGCIGSVAENGAKAIGCVRSGCCEYNFHVNSLCNGDNVVCCYSQDTCDGDILCTGSEAENGNPAVGCVSKDCCEYNYYIDNKDYCKNDGTVCCYSRNRCGGQGNCDNLEIVTRSEWGARAPTHSNRLSTPVGYLFLHHTVSNACTSKSSCIGVVKGIQDWHMDGRDWSDIGYNYLIGGDGRAYEGRGWNSQGGHTYGYNSIAVAISFIGDFMTIKPSDKMFQAAKDLINCAEREGILTSNYRMFGHRDAKCTNCPGDQVYNEMQNWPHFSHDDITYYC